MSNASPAPPASTSNDAIPPVFGTKMPSTIAFAIGILLFFMPFVDIRCNNTSLQKITGMELATGFAVKGPGSEKSLLGDIQRMNDSNIRVINRDRKDPNLYAILALGLGVIGLVLSLVNARADGIGGLLCGALAAAGLLGLLLDIRQQVRQDVGLQDRQDEVVIIADFSTWFYLSLISFVAAALLSYARIRANK